MYILEHYLAEYAKKVVEQLKVKFKKENPDLTDDQIDYYVNRFEEVVKSPEVKNKDINSYTFKELEKIVDSFPKDNGMASSVKNTAEVQGTAIYNKDGVEVYLGDERHKCITYRKYFEGETKKAYGWCISRSDVSSNMYNGYRHGGGYAARVFYFVIDRNVGLDDDNHVFVVHVFDDGKYGYSSSHNNGDKEELSWDELVRHANVLTKLPQELFKAKPLTDDEKKIYEITKGERYDDSLYDAFNGNFELCKAYIELHNHDLYPKQVKDLLQRPKYWAGLVNLYISKGHDFQDKELWSPINFTTYLPKPMLLNYTRMGVELIKNGNKISNTRFKLMYDSGMVDEKVIAMASRENLKYLLGMTGDIGYDNIVDVVNLKDEKSIVAIVVDGNSVYSKPYTYNGQPVEDVDTRTASPYLLGAYLSNLNKKVVVYEAFFISHYNIFTVKVSRHDQHRDETTGEIAPMAVHTFYDIERGNQYHLYMCDKNLNPVDVSNIDLRGLERLLTPTGQRFAGKDTAIVSYINTKHKKNLVKRVGGYGELFDRELTVAHLVESKNVINPTLLINMKGDITTGKITEKEILSEEVYYNSDRTAWFNTKYRYGKKQLYCRVRNFSFKSEDTGEPVTLAELDSESPISFYINVRDEPTLPAISSELDTNSYNTTAKMLGKPSLRERTQQQSQSLNEAYGKMSRLIKYRSR
jgi:hypothetical protein